MREKTGWPPVTDPGQSHPWDSDRDLTAEDAASAVVEQFPDLTGEAAELVGWGWDYDAYRFGDWVFLFPKRAAVADRIPIEAKRSKVFSELLSDLGVAVPVFERIGRPSEAFPYRYAGYPWIDGVGADTVDLDMTALAHRLGRVLTRLHETDPLVVDHLSIPEEREGAGDWYDEVIEYAEVLRNVLGDDLAGCVDWLESIEDFPPRHKGPLRLLHNDLGPDHVLVDADSGGLVGIIDFDDVAFGDPMLDFVNLRIWGGPAFVDEVLSQYGPALDAGFHERLDFVGRIASLEWVYDAHLQRADVDKHRRWVQTAFTDRA